MIREILLKGVLIRSKQRTQLGHIYSAHAVAQIGSLLVDRVKKNDTILGCLSDPKTPYHSLRDTALQVTGVELGADIIHVVIKPMKTPMGETLAKLIAMKVPLRAVLVGTGKLDIDSATVLTVDSVDRIDVDTGDGIPEEDRLVLVR